MSAPVAVRACHAVDGGDGGGNARFLAAEGVHDDLLGCDALAELFKKLLIAALKTDIHDAEPMLAQRTQFLVRLALDGLGGGVGRDALALGKVVADIVENGQKIVHRQDERIAVGEKDLFDIARIGAGLGEVRKDLLDGVDGELFVLVHRAEGALIVAAPAVLLAADIPSVAAPAVPLAAGIPSVAVPAVPLAAGIPSVAALAVHYLQVALPELELHTLDNLSVRLV